MTPGRVRAPLRVPPVTLGAGPVGLDTDLIRRNLVLQNQGVFGAVNAGHEAFAARSLITGRYPVERHRELLLGQAQGIKNVLSFA